MNGYYQRNSYNSYDNRRNQENNQHHQYYQHPTFGTLTPILRRQRAFHDAIYEEEYGSDQEEECCQSRGMSAVFCWFLSVIILIGLAASVVLTVFFILKSKGHLTQNGELDLLFDGDGGISFRFPETTTELNNLDFPLSASSKESSLPSSISIEENDNDETENNSRFGTSSSKSNTAKASSTTTTTTTTRFPPSRKGPSEIFDEKSSGNSKTFSPSITGIRNTFSREDFPQTVSKESHNNDRPTINKQPSDETKTLVNEESEEDPRTATYRTTTASPPVQEILFTSSPDISVAPSNNRRNLQTTRFPTGRTSFSTSTPIYVSTAGEQEESDNEEENVAHSDKNENNHEDTEEDENENQEQTLTTHHEGTITVPTPTVLYESKEKHITEDTYKSEESQLNKMLLEEIPPHHSPEVVDNLKESSEEETSKPPGLSSEFNLPVTTISTPREDRPLDPLARLIKNLAPKWGRNRTIETTTISAGNHRYDFTISSREKDNEKDGKYKSKETSTRSTVIVTPETLIRDRLRPNDFKTKLKDTRGNGIETVSILNTIQSPNLNRRQDQETENNEGAGQFLDILVGSEDHKTLVTKQTEDGIVTSAILPPWYDTNGGNNNKHNVTDANQHAINQETESSSEEETNQNGHNENGSNEEGNEDVTESETTSVFGGLFDLFRKASNPRLQQGNDPKRIVLKRPGGELLAQGSSYISHSSENINRVGNNDNIQNKSQSFKDLIRKAIPGLQSSTTIATLDTPVATDDITPANNGFHYGTRDGGTNIYGYYPDEDDKEADRTVEHHGIQSEAMSDEIMDHVQDNPSHSIEVQVPDESAEIVIEQDKVNEDMTHLDKKFGETHAESEAHERFVPAPVFHGGGIRRPLEDGELPNPIGDLDMKGSEIRPVFVTASPLNSSVQNTKVANNFTTTGQGNHKYSFVDPLNVSEEINDNSAEKDHNPSDMENNGSLDYDHEEDHQQSHTHSNERPHGSEEFNQSVGSYEGAATGNKKSTLEEKHNKWSERDKFGSMGLEENGEGNLPPSAPTGSEELKVNPDSGDHNEVFERKPVVQLDEKLYPDSSDMTGGSQQSMSEETKVHQIYPVGYESSTTERPLKESTISGPEKSEEIKKIETNGFVPPTPVSFHDNKYTFQPPSDSIYQSKDGWRPLVNQNEGESVSTRPPYWHTKSTMLMPTKVPSRLTTSPIKYSNPVNANTNSNQNFEEGLEDDEEMEGDEEEFEEEPIENGQELHKYPWGNRERLMEKQINAPVPSKVKFPDSQNTQESFERDLEPQPQNLQIQHHHQQQPLPIQHQFKQIPVEPGHPQQSPQIQHQPQQQQQLPVQHQQQQFPVQHQQQQFPVQHQQQQFPVQQHHQQPDSIQHQSQQSSQHHSPHSQQIQHHSHHVTHQQRQQFLFNKNNPSPNIDRSKYMMRPAPPPIVMRRAPIQSMYNLSNRNGPQRANLIPKVQQQNQLISNGTPTEFQQSPHNFINGRRFKTLGSRPRSLVNWPIEESKGKLNVAERRMG